MRGEFALGIERMQAALNEAYAPRRRRRATSSARASPSTSSSTRAPAPTSAARRRRCSRASRASGASPASSRRTSRRPSASTARRPSSTTSRRCRTCRGSSLNGGAAFAALGEGRSTGTRIFSLSGHVNRPGNYEVEMAKTTFRDLIYDADYGAGIRDGNAAEGVHPRRRVGAWFGPEQLDMPLDQDDQGQGRGGGSMLGSGSIIVMDDTTCMVRAAWRLARFFARESCGQCTPCREGTRLAREDHAPHRGRAQAARTTSTCCSTCATTSRPGLSVAVPRHDDDLRPRARRSRRRSSRPSGCSATSS